MNNIRSSAPPLVKKLMWDRKHRSNSIDPAKCPDDLLESLDPLKPDSAILDLGCGTGNLRAALRMRGWKGHFIGVDVSQVAIETARKSEDENSEWHVSTIENFPIPTQMLDAVVFCESIYYVKQEALSTLLRRCHQPLALGGRIISRIWDPDEHHDYVKVLLKSGAEDSSPLYILTK